MWHQRIFPYFQDFVQQLRWRKLYHDLETQTHIRNRFPRSLTKILLIGIGLGGSIGHTIFVLGGQAAGKYAGPSVIVSFIIGVIIAFLSALSMSEMSSIMSSSGSAYTYAYVALGEYPGFMIAWLLTLLYQIGASVVVVSWSNLFLYFIDLISGYNITSSLVEAPVAWSADLNTFYRTDQVINLPAIIIIILLTLLLIIGIRETALVNFVLVVIKVIILLIFIITGSIHIDRKNYTPFFPPSQGSFGHFGFTGMLRASNFVFFAYVGFESITSVAQEAKQPSRSMPCAILISFTIMALIYISVSIVMVGLVPYQALNTTYPLITAAKAIFDGKWAPILLTLGALTGVTTVAITFLAAQSRIFYAMAIDGLLPPYFARIHHRTLTPWISITICGTACTLLSGVCPLDILGEMASLAALIVYIFIHVCLIVMRYTHGDIPRPFRVPFGAWLIPISGILLCILLLINTTGGTGIRFGAWMAIGHIIYFSYSFWHSKGHLDRRQGSFASVNVSVLPETPITSHTQKSDAGSETIESTRL